MVKYKNKDHFLRVSCHPEFNCLIMYLRDKINSNYKIKIWDIFLVDIEKQECL